jgi:hypothetical protein
MKRVAKRVSEKNPEAAAAAAEGGNGKAQAKPAAPQIQTKKVGDLKTAETKTLVGLEQMMMKKMAEIGDITMQIDAAKRQQAALADEIIRMRQERASAMKQIVISHGFDPDKQRYTLMLDKKEIHTTA